MNDQPIDQRPTPETDAELDSAHNFALEYDCQSEHDNIPRPIVVPADFARRLERDLAEAREQLAAALHSNHSMIALLDTERELRKDAESNLQCLMHYAEGREGHAVVSGVAVAVRDAIVKARKWQNEYLAAKCVGDTALGRLTEAREQLAEVMRERDELAGRFTKLDQPRYSGAPMLDGVLATRNEAFTAWVESLPATYWARYDLSAARIGWEAASGSMTEQLAAERAQLARWESELSAVMPPDFKDWWQNDKREWPMIAAGCIAEARKQRDLAWSMLPEWKGKES